MQYIALAKSFLCLYPFLLHILFYSNFIVEYWSSLGLKLEVVLLGMHKKSLNLCKLRLQRLRHDVSKEGEREISLLSTLNFYYIRSNFFHLNQINRIICSKIVVKKDFF